MPKKSYRFESEVHLGLLVIIFVLLLLNVFSNYVVFKARIGMEKKVTDDLRTTTILISRTASQAAPFDIGDEKINELKNRYGLNVLLIVAPPPDNESVAEKRAWFRSITAGLPPDQISLFGDKLLKVVPEKLVKGNGSEYFYVNVISTGVARKYLIISKEIPELAFLENNGKTVLFVAEAGVAVVALIYLLLSRFIFSPFRKLKQKVIQAGRKVDFRSGEVEPVVEEYQQIIAELHEKEAELTKLNLLIKERADSLEEFNRHLLASVSMGVVTLGLDGKVLIINDTAAAIIGVDPEKQKKQILRYENLFQNHDQLKKAICSFIDGGEPQGYREYVFQKEGAKQVFVGVTVSQIRDSQNSVIGISILLTDVTELHSLRMQLEQRNRLEALGEMAGGLAHQLRNSIGAIVGYGTLFKRKLAKGDISQSAETSESLLREAREAEQLIGKFLTFSRPFDFQPCPVDLGVLLNEIMNVYRSREEYQGIQFSSQVQEDIEVFADSVLLKQALMNIIENSVLACTNLIGEISVRVMKNKESSIIEITDTGCGISSDKIGKIFTPFYSSRPSGTGLGLPFASRIIDLHAGSISVTSEPGIGTTFRLTIPCKTGVLETV